MSENKTYNIETIEDIFDCVNPDNIENFIEGFNELLRSYVQKVDSERAKIREKGANDAIYKNSEICSKKSIIYVDDNKQNNKTTYHYRKS